MRITESADALQIELIPRPAREVLPRMFLCMVAGLAIALSLDVGLMKLGVGHWLAQGAGWLVTMQSIWLICFLVDYDRYELTFRVDKTALNIIAKHPLNSWRRHLPLSELNKIQVVGLRQKTITFAIHNRGLRLWIARKPQYVAEICTRLNVAVSKFRQLPDRIPKA